MIFLRILAFLAGALLSAAIILSAVRTFVLPRAAPDRLSRFVFVLMRKLFDLRLRFAKSYIVKDRILAFYAPLTLLVLPLIWLTLVSIGFTGMFWGLRGGDIGETFLLSGSSILTLGFAPANTLGERLLAFTEATIGLIMVAMLISYLPTIYNAFSQREIPVNLLDVRAGSPPSAVEMLSRITRIGQIHMLEDLWRSWEAWFAQLEESHTSLPVLVFFRSPVPEYSWITAAGTILDAAALYNSTLAVQSSPSASLCIRAGYLALRRIADFFGVTYDTMPQPDDPISISRDEFDLACQMMLENGVELKEDLDQAWRDFAGWRVNYDTVLLALCSITMAPYAPWSSDRAPKYRSPNLFGPGVWKRMTVPPTGEMRSHTVRQLNADTRRLGRK